MGSIFKRGDSRYWWLGYTDSTGRRCMKSSETEDRKSAEKLLAAIEKRVRAERESGLNTAPLTVSRYAAKWLEVRRKRGVASSSEDEDRLNHALPHIGRLLLKDVRRKHIVDLMHDLERAKNKRGSAMAPRTVLHVYGVLRVMFEDAQMEELIAGSPCTLRGRRGELPRKLDKDPAWRDSAIFTRAEVELLLSDERIPLYRRTTYGFLFLAGLRINEVTPRRWRDYDPDAEYLGRLTIGSSYAVKRRQEKPATKTGRTRHIPVHPTLARMLAEWRLHGWQEYVGRRPVADDLILPRLYVAKRGTVPDLGIIHSNTTLRNLHRDCETVGLRPRRQHDARRTFITLGIADGGRKDILRWVSHGPGGDREAFDLYVSLPWKTLCDEVARLKVDLLSGNVVSLNKGAT